MSDLFKIFLALAALGLGLLFLSKPAAFDSPKSVQSIEDLYNLELRPFYHGVASGDPASDGFVIWTRVTPSQEGPVNVSWEVARDSEFSKCCLGRCYQHRSRAGLHNQSSHPWITARHTLLLSIYSARSLLHCWAHENHTRWGNRTTAICCDLLLQPTLGPLCCI